MRKFDWKDIAEMIGIAAIVASLIFVGLQLRQSQEIALSSTYQARSQMSVDIATASFSSPEFMSGTAKLYRNEQDLITPEELVALEYQLGAYLILWENQHFQFESGFLPEEHWLKNVREIRCQFSTPIYRELIEGWDFRKSFRQVIDAQIKDAIENPGNCRLN